MIKQNVKFQSVDAFHVDKLETATGNYIYLCALVMLD